MIKNVLIAYYSWSGVTKKVAEKIDHKLPHSDLIEIKVAPNTFSDDMYETFDISKKQIANNDYPEVNVDVNDFSKYDLILVGSPVWGGKPATPIYSFLKKLKDYQGKVASFYMDAGSVGDYDQIFKKWTQGLDTLNSGREDRNLENWMLA